MLNVPPYLLLKKLIVKSSNSYIHLLGFAGSIVVHKSKYRIYYHIRHRGFATEKFRFMTSYFFFSFLRYLLNLHHAAEHHINHVNSHRP